MTMSRRPFGHTPPPHSSQYSSHSSDPANSSTTSPLTATSPLMADDDDDDDENTTTPPPLHKPSHKPSFPPREDCWSEDATYTLIEAWGDRYIELKRGNLRQKHWQEVAAAVNSLHGHTKKLRRTDIQCKNRMDTVKKKYKIEKSRVSNSAGDYTSPWPFFVRLDSLLGGSFKSSPAAVVTRRRAPALPPPPSSVPVGPRSKRPVPERVPFTVDETVSKRRFSAMVVAAAAADKAESDTSRNSYRDGAPPALEEGYRRLADAIGRFGEIYQRVEGEKQRQMIELEKQRMRFAKDLEIQRMKLFTDSQVQLERIKRAKFFMKSPRSGR